jgi:hypothetical protein
MMAKKQFPLRIDPALYAVLERWAADELRSVNAHIEFLLREAARKAGRLSDSDTQASNVVTDERGDDAAKSPADKRSHSP